MLRSMTGYAAVSARREHAAVSVTVKSVNHRFLDLHLKLPPELEPLEPQVRRLVRDHLSRGHLSVTIALERDGGLDARVDRALVMAYLQTYNRLRSEFSIAAEADLNAILRIPGAVIYTPALLWPGESEELSALVMGALGDALEKLDAMRAEEGRAIAAELAERIAQVRNASAEIAELRLGAEQHYLQRLHTRLAELRAESLPEDRLAQEAALLVERSDISEELLRINSHQEQFQQLLRGDDSRESGKRLDFLLQEMNREANTILSKTSGLGEAGIRITRQGLAMKAEIEKLREQVQNLQ